MDFKKLKSLRKEQNLTQTELSEKAGVGKVTISRLESGALKESNVSTLLKIAKALGCEVIGKGTKEDPVRHINQYWDLDGTLLAENDGYLIGVNRIEID